MNRGRGRREVTISTFSGFFRPDVVSRHRQKTSENKKKRVVETEADQIVMTGSVLKEGWFKMYTDHRRRKK